MTNDHIQKIIAEFDKKVCTYDNVVSVDALLLDKEDYLMLKSLLTSTYTAGYEERLIDAEKKKGGFYKHLDGSLICKKCELTLSEGCKCYEKK